MLYTWQDKKHVWTECKCSQNVVTGGGMLKNLCVAGTMTCEGILNISDSTAEMTRLQTGATKELYPQTPCHILQKWIPQSFITWFTAKALSLKLITMNFNNRFMHYWTSPYRTNDNSVYSNIIFFWVVPRRVNIKCWRFGNMCRLHLHRT
jgi:hypothetical protein